MKTIKDTYESPNVDRIVADVRANIRTKADLEYCVCPLCKAALKILRGDNK